MKTLVDHDVPVGPLEHCQITGSAHLNLVMDFGHQPPCDALVAADQVAQPEKTYPLRLMHCPESGLAQLDYVVDGREIYPAHYPYRAGTSWPLKNYQRQFAEGIVERFGLVSSDLAVDVGCNDGTLLEGFKRAGVAVCGVEPTDNAQFASKEHGIMVIQDFFTEKVAMSIRKDFPEGAKVVTMTNVFAHMAPLGEVMRALMILMANDGIFITESHYLLDVLEKNQFDTVYHEHIRTYSLKSLTLLVGQYNMEVFDAVRADRYGGNIRAYISWKGQRNVQPAVGALLLEEESKGLHEQKTWAAWAARVRKQRDSFMEFLYQAHRIGATVRGVSAPGRAATLLNYYGVRSDLIGYLAEPPKSLKIGKYVPGCKLPILDNSILRSEQPDYAVIFAWHYAEPIVKRLRGEGVRSKLIVPLPEFRVLDD